MAPFQVSAPGPPEPEPGLGDPAFSDCVLGVCLDPGSRLLESPGGGQSRVHDHTQIRRKCSRSRAREVPVCTLVLAAKSEYFRALLTGSFSEGARREEVDIHVPEDGEGAFMDLLYFLYNGGVHPHLPGSIPRALKLLVLSDILHTQDCFAECVTLLKGSVDTLRLSDAVLFLSLPPLLQTRPCLSGIMESAKRCIVTGHSPFLRAPYGPLLFSIPEHVLTLMLESDDLAVENEDDVLEASKAWVSHNYPSCEVEALSRIVLPRVRHLALSPKALLSLALWEKQVFFGIDDLPGTTCPQLSAPDVSQQAVMPRFTPKPASDDWDMDCTDALSAATSSATSAAATEAHEASLAALLALSERCFVEYSSVPGGRSLCKYMTGRVWRPPRTSCLPPCGRLYLDIPLHCCRGMAWQPVDDDLASSSLTLVSGRWLELKAQYHSDLGTLGLWVEWHKDVNGVGPTSSASAQCWRARCKFCVMTEASQPAYQTLHSTVANFEVEVACWGVQGALNMASILEESEFFFPQGALRIRVDIWLLT